MAGNEKEENEKLTVTQTREGGYLVAAKKEQ
jgi:hypothetical protein